MLTKTNNFAVASYSFHGLHNLNAMNIFGYLETVKYRYNLSTADIWNGYLDNYDDDYIRLLDLSIKERNLTVVNFCCDGAHIWDNDPHYRAEYEKLARTCLKTAEKIGAKSIRFDMGVREDVISDEQMEYLVNKYSEYCKIANEFGAKLGPENHWGAAQKFPQFEKFVNIMKNEQPNFGILLHLGGWGEHATTEERDKNDIEMAKNAFHIHIDYEHCMEADRVLPPLKQAGYSGCWTIESHKSTNEYNNVAFQLAQVKRVIAPMVYDGSWEDAPPCVKE